MRKLNNLSEDFGSLFFCFKNKSPGFYFFTKSSKTSTKWLFCLILDIFGVIRQSIFMNRNLIVIGLIASIAFFTSCSNSEQKTEIEEDIIQEEPILYTGDNSATSLDWNGTYKGTVPCARCEGIETTLTLKIDLTYKLSTHYFGLNDALEEDDMGTFTWDKTGSIITLEKVSNGPRHYKVGENRIWQLDMNGHMITGDLADHYILTKIQ